MLQHWLPLIELTIFIVAGFVWRSWVHYRRHRELGLRLFQGGRWQQHLRDALFIAMTILLLGQAVAYACRSDLMEPTIVLPALISTAGQIVGSVLVAVGTVLTVVAQIQLGASWRIGIDELARPGLVTGGVYQRCRNPIFLAMILALGGNAVLLPSWISLSVLAGAILAIRVQVLDEERYLLGAYGEDYREYASVVGRFLPGIGKLH